PPRGRATRAAHGRRRVVPLHTPAGPAGALLRVPAFGTATPARPDRGRALPAVRPRGRARAGGRPPPHRGRPGGGPGPPDPGGSARGGLGVRGRGVPRGGALLPGGAGGGRRRVAPVHARARRAALSRRAGQLSRAGRGPVPRELRARRRRVS